MSPLVSRIAPIAFFAIAACHSAAERVPGDAKDHHPWSGIAATETVNFTGTEPFWSGRVGPAGLTYTTIDNQAGETVPVTRFAGRGGVSFSGSLAKGAITLAVTPAPCSDGMSNTRYPYVVTLQVGAETRRGCGWTDRHPRTQA
ncbi:COG3650 family protein [Novosphingobium sp. Leaf2]|uniref:COG3650 family protein n=1 Tax=Novosphingobium sp. Leaf2 TaxID=1735670 RepID=UPI0006F902C7|nr:hypothetical protein [Novosphingobium sp. Leaf2]KQM21329.1 hypothetical protein ASE49_14670 [Novosphingobium sp. Leaf2]